MLTIAPALCQHLRNDVFHPQEAGLEVDVEGAVPVLDRQLDHAAHRGDADVVHQNVDAAETVHAGIAHRRHLIRAGSVGDMGHRGAALGRDQRGGFLGRGGVAVHAHHPRALPGQGHGDGLAIAPARPDRPRAHHQRGPVLHTSVHRGFPFVVQHHRPSIMSGRKVVICGKANSSVTVTISIRTNQLAPRNTCVSGVWRSIPAMTKQFNPTGRHQPDLAHLDAEDAEPDWIEAQMLHGREHDRQGDDHHRERVEEHPQRDIGQQQQRHDRVRRMPDSPMAPAICWGSCTSVRK